MRKSLETVICVNRYSYGEQFGINCTALDQSKLSNFVECTINLEIIQWIIKEFQNKINITQLSEFEVNDVYLRQNSIG